MSATMITSEVDFDKDGKQEGYLRVPHSVHRSAYGWVPVPITVIRNGKHPTLAITAAVHGDEYEGQIAVANLARELEAGDIAGRLILLPALNLPAAEAGSRVSPVDELNLNRIYPGNPAGTLTEKIAHYHEEVVLPMADYSVDLHSGGSSLVYPAAVLRGSGHSAKQKAGIKLMSDAFDLPYAWVSTSSGGPKSTARTTMGAMNRKRVAGIMAELGGAGCVTPDVLRRTERGLRRILHALGMLPGYRPDAANGTRSLEIAGIVHAYGTGVFEPLKEVGGDVAEGEEVALIHHPETPGLAPDPVVSPYTGIVLAKRAMARVQRGDALFQIAADADT